MKKIRMKTNVLLLFALCLGFMSFKKSKKEPKDHRKEILGDYSGFTVKTFWIDSIVDYGHDTFDVTLTIVPLEQDSLVAVTFDPPYSKTGFSFTYADSLFTSTSIYHPPMLKFNNDTLYFMHQPGFAPFWTECFTKKDK